MRADCTTLITTAARCPASSLPTNIQAFRLCATAHNRNNWLFAGSLRAGQRAAAAMSLIQSTRMNRQDPHVYLKKVLTRQPRRKASHIEELPPHRWQAEAI